MRRIKSSVFIFVSLGIPALLNFMQIISSAQIIAKMYEEVIEEEEEGEENGFFSFSKIFLPHKNHVYVYVKVGLYFFTNFLHDLVA